MNYAQFKPHPQLIDKGYLDIRLYLYKMTTRCLIF